MALHCGLVRVWMLLVVHVVQQPHCFPKVRITGLRRGKMPHRIGHRVAMFAQALRLDPLVKNGECTIDLCAHISRERWSTADGLSIAASSANSIRDARPTLIVPSPRGF